ncbi:hypothetical protein DRH27_02420 [Candidatus Falkowbacteria bacterium]|nr:MAG: hypothetical protein DRH27_02420 [Candidatus Falkowbacteria bacterium]
MNNFQNKKLQTAKLLIRFFGIFGSLTELLIIFSIINFMALFVFNTKNDIIYLFTVLTTIIIYIIYVFTTQAINGRTYVQKIQKIFIFNENGKKIQLKDSFKRMASKLIVFIFWLIPWFILSFFISSKYNSDFQILPIIKLTLFFGLFSFPILMIPIISNKKQTLYDYLSSTIVLVNYEEIKKEEKENINRLIDDPFIIDKENPNVSIQARLIAIIIFFILKIFKKKF